MPSVLGTVPQGLDTIDNAELQSGAKEMLLTGLENRLQCGSKACPGKGRGDRAEQAMVNVPCSDAEGTATHRKSVSQQ